MTVLYVMDIETGRWLADEIPGKVDFAGWGPKNRGFLYGKLEDPEDAYSRSFRYHELGRHHRQDPLLFVQEEPTRIPSAQLLALEGRNHVMLENEPSWPRFRDKMRAFLREHDD